MFEASELTTDWFILSPPDWAICMSGLPRRNREAALALDIGRDFSGELKEKPVSLVLQIIEPLALLGRTELGIGLDQAHGAP